MGTLSPSRPCFSRVYSKHCTYGRYITQTTRTQTTHTQTYRTVTYTLTQTRNIVNILKEFLFCIYLLYVPDAYPRRHIKPAHIAKKVIITDVRVIPKITGSYHELRDKTQNNGTTPQIMDPVIFPAF